MCVTSGKAELANTIVYAGEAMRGDKLVHTLGYQNSVENMEGGPNAMILPFPTNVEMTPENVIDTSQCKSFLKDYAEAIRPQSRSIQKNFGGPAAAGHDVHVFNTGMYTVVLSRSAAGILKALEQVPENKRPKISTQLMLRYSKWYPGQPIAVCCFDGNFESEPLLWWYEPSNPKVLFAPALDGHGEIPNLEADVEVDHSILFGSTIQQEVGFKLPKWRSYPEEIKASVSEKAYGHEYKHQTMKNGDFYLEASILHDDQYKLSIYNLIKRMAPSGA